MRRIFILSAIAIILSVLSSNDIFTAEEMTKDDRARFGLAQSLVNKGRHDEAEDTLTDLHRRYPEDKDISLALAQALGYGLKLNEAISLIDELEKNFPEDEDIRYIHANILEANQHFSEARKIYLELLEKWPSDDALRSKIADISSWMGDYEAAIGHYEFLLKKHKEDLSLKLKIADVYLWSKNYYEAITLYKETGINPQIDKKRFKNLGDAYLGMERYDDALDIYKRLFELYPEDAEIRADIANALYAAGKIEEAEKEFKIIIEQHPQDIKIMLKIAEILALRKRYGEAMEVCRGVLSIDPDNSVAKLWLARISSWNMRYRESLKLYDDIISKDPKWIIPRREKARVLGWTRQYQQSIFEYKKIPGEVKQDEAAGIEMLSKNNFYKRYDTNAIDKYKTWLSLEPENLEALYDLGQVYARQMQWANAKNTYEHILEILPEHFRAEQALDKVSIYSKSVPSDTGFEYYEADSSGRGIDKSYYNIYTALKAPLREDLYFVAREDTFIYKFTNPSSENCERISVGIEYIKKPLFWAKVNYAYNMYSSDVDGTHNFNEEINLRPLDAALLTFSHNHEHVMDNGQTFSNRLERDDYKIRGTFDLNRRLSTSVDYMYSDYDDGNWKHTFGTDSSCVLIYEPTFLKIIYRYEEYKFDKERDSYFTPSSFHFNKAGLEWRHFLNKEELFWGANDTYYTLRYTVIFDVHDEQGHKLYADFHRDWTDRLSTDVEWSKTIYEHKSTYSEQRVLVSLKYYF